MSNDARALLAIITGRDTDGLIEVRCRRPSDGRITAREWFPLSDTNDCLHFIAERAARLDVYVGVAPRTGREGGKAAIKHSWLLYVDADSAEAAARVRCFKHPPSLVVRSGSGENVHAYWSLSYPLSPAWFERANRRLAYDLGADVKVTDAARILRPPGSWNHKSDPPSPVTIDDMFDVRLERWNIAQLVGRLPDPPSKRPAMAVRPKRAISHDNSLEVVSAEHYYMVLTGRELLRGNVICPFHKDGRERQGSMRLYDTTWYCFVCCEGGSVYEFGARLWGLGTRGSEFVELRDRLQRELGVR